MRHFIANRDGLPQNGAKCHAGVAKLLHDLQHTKGGTTQCQTLIYIWVIHSKQCAKCPITNTRWRLLIRRTVWIKAWQGGLPERYGTRVFFNMKDKAQHWDVAPDAEYFDQLMRVSQNQIIWGGNYFPSIWQHGGRCVIAWDKCQPWPNFSQIGLAWTSYNKPARGLFKFDNRTRGKIHPTQKPIDLYLWLLDTFAQPGDTILDTHLGSGSIACACYDAGYDLMRGKLIQSTTQPSHGTTNIAAKRNYFKEQNNAKK